MERVGDLVCGVGESPVWDAVDAAWYWVDIPARRVWRMDGSSGALRHWDTSEMVACVAPKASGGLIAGMESGLFSLELGDARQAGETRLSGAEGLGPGLRFNDGRCDRQGRFWAGTMFMDMAAARAVGRLFRYEAGAGISAPVVSELLTQNGLAFSPDSRVMYLSDSHPQRRLVWAFDYDAETGVPSNRRLFADLNQHVGRPDGAAVDADGCYWICANDAGCLLRFTPEGRLDRRVDVPMLKPAMCAFGGDDLRTLLVTSIPSGKPEDADWGGAVVTLRPGVQGVAEVRFNG
ncbi:SMP-30/gluconolactonase/LRE family protein [Pseudoduganella namucuonensis]|uniref:Gluconolactonase n=1 Tax=Pseudoduganella namucuonensis TaxID=1035707 RepID=A0A1I7EXN1_9BURK|nr:SMP-30/gluconolactonase/LRE family protein [Pseudoduganella namucuonensis]SFU28639.1 gluconolactonase [Pseudoduganella namucuonensis]